MKNFAMIIMRAISLIRAFLKTCFYRPKSMEICRYIYSNCYLCYESDSSEGLLTERLPSCDL